MENGGASLVVEMVITGAGRIESYNFFIYSKNCLTLKLFAAAIMRQFQDKVDHYAL